MSISAISGAAQNYSPEQTSGADKVTQLKQQLQNLSNQLDEIKGNDKLDPKQKEKQIESLEKKIAALEKQIANMQKSEAQAESTDKDDAKTQLEEHNEQSEERDEESEFALPRVLKNRHLEEYA